MARGSEVCASVPDVGERLKELDSLRQAGCQILAREPLPTLYRLARKVLPLPEQERRHLKLAANGANLVVISQGASTDGIRWMEETGRSSIKYVVIAHTATEFWWPDDSLARRLAEGYGAAEAAYFVSQATAALCRRQFATPLSNARVIRNPFNVRYDAHPQWPGDSVDDFSLACVGRLDVGTKGQDLLLEVLSLSHWRDRSIRLSLVGNGVNERVLRHRAEELKLTSVEFLGHRSDIEGVWAKHRVMVQPSRQEGMPLGLVEAMLCGRPCVVTDVGGCKELVRDDVNGFVAKAPTVELLDEALSRAWQNRDRLRQMGEQASADVREWVSANPAEDFAHELEELADRVATK